jgi:hypothetical protein
MVAADAVVPVDATAVVAVAPVADRAVVAVLLVADRAVVAVLREVVHLDVTAAVRLFRVPRVQPHPVAIGDDRSDVTAPLAAVVALVALAAVAVPVALVALAAVVVPVVQVALAAVVVPVVQVAVVGPVVQVAVRVQRAIDLKVRGQGLGAVAGTSQRLPWRRPLCQPRNLRLLRLQIRRLAIATPDRFDVLVGATLWT